MSHRSLSRAPGGGGGGRGTELSMRAVAIEKCALSIGDTEVERLSRLPKRFRDDVVEWFLHGGE